MDIPETIMPFKNGLADIRGLPQKESIAGIYFMCCGKNVVYVGQSKNIRKRMHGHIYRQVYDRIYYLDFSGIPQSKIIQLENIFIGYIRPFYNSGSDLYQKTKKDDFASELYEWRMSVRKILEDQP